MKLRSWIFAGLTMAFVLSIAGCHHKPHVQIASAPPPTPVPSVVVQKLYMPLETAPGKGAIVQIPATASGSIVPTTVLTDDNGVLFSLATDSSGNFYAIETSANRTVSIVEFAAGATGVATPLRKISGPATGLNSPAVLAVDAKGNIVVGFGSRSPSIEYFGSDANGNVAPLRTISGNLTGLGGGIQQISLAPNGQIAFVSVGMGGFRASTFAPGANGNVAPSILKASVADTAILGLTTDSDGDIYMTSTLLNMQNDRVTSSTPTIEEFSPGATTPIRTITPSGDGRMAGIQLDSSGNLFVVCGDRGPNLEIQKFAAGATGAASPVATFSFVGTTGQNADGSLAVH